MTHQMSFSLFLTIDRHKKRAVPRCSEPCPFIYPLAINGRSCRRSSCSPAALYPPHEQSDSIKKIILFLPFCGLDFGGQHSQG